MSLRHIDDVHSRKVPPREVSVDQLRVLEQMAFHLRTLTEARRELELALQHRDVALAGRASRRLLAVGALYGDFANRLGAFE